MQIVVNGSVQINILMLRQAEKSLVDCSVLAVFQHTKSNKNINKCAVCSGVRSRKSINTDIKICTHIYINHAALNRLKFQKPSND